MRSSALSILPLMALAASCASSPTSGTSALLAPDPGTVFIFDDGRVERFVRDEGDAQVWATRRGREYVRATNPALPILEWQVGERSGTRTVFGDSAELWPPEPGQRARFRVLTEVEEGEENSRSVQAWTCSVGHRGQKKVPAGSYTIMPIICERFSLNTMRLLERRTWWWSEDIGHYVRRRYQSVGSGEVRDIRLCAAVPPHRASSARIDAVRETCRG